MKTYQCTFLVFLLFFGGLSMAQMIAQDNPSINGIWQMRGYGVIFQVDDDKVTAFDTTSISCLSSTEYPRAMMASDYELDGNVLTLGVGISTYTLDKLEQLPELCSGTLSRKRKKDPFYNFDVLWHTFNDQYAYFDLRGVDWDASYEKYRSQITPKTSDVELFRICYQMIDDLGDGHADIEASDKLMEKAFPNEDEEDDVSFKELYQSIAERYVKDLKAHNYTKSFWGKINDQVGYLQVNDMVAQAYYGITPEMDKQDAQKLYGQRAMRSENHMQDEVDGMHKTMERMLKDVAGVEKLIIDVRFNGGGFDAVSFEILRSLISKPTEVFKKHARLMDTTTATYTYTLEPAEQLFNGEVYFLQSPFSGSATETMLLATMEIPNSKRVGTTSEGILSDALTRVLPNGWDFSLSNESYLTLDGTNYEQSGIPVDVPIDYSRDAATFYNDLKTQLKNGDQAIEWVLKK